MTSALDICNAALARLGEPPIHGIDINGTLPQRMCAMHYHPTRREVLCVNPWDFATRETTLHTLCIKEAGYARSVPHTLPQDCLRVLEVRPEQYTLSGRSIFCQGDEAQLRYITDEEDVKKFDARFTEAFIVRLACKLCIPLINSLDADNALLEEYKGIILPHMQKQDNPLYETIQ